MVAMLRENIAVIDCVRPSGWARDRDALVTMSMTLLSSWWCKGSRYFVEDHKRCRPARSSKPHFLQQPLADLLLPSA